MKKLFKTLLYKIVRRKFILNFDRFCINPNGRALIYYKTENFLLNGFFQDASHTNNWESYQMVKILNKMGFVVDILDRTAELKDIKKIEDKYDLFVGIGAGDSGRYFADIGERLTKAKKILYAMGPEPDLSNEITKNRHDYFRERHPGINVVDRRLIKNVNTERLYKAVDGIISIGNDFSFGSYKKTGKPLEKVYLSTYPDLRMELAEFRLKSPKKFLYFGGNGNITKGLDLVLEVFKKNPDLELSIGAPTTEKDFNIFADSLIKEAPNIKHWGFVDVTSNKFYNITKDTGYVILPSSSEGCATSVTTCMRRGLVPVVTPETGLENVASIGFETMGTIEDLERVVRLASSVSEKELQKKTLLTYIESFKYTQDSFSASFETAILKLML